MDRQKFKDYYNRCISLGLDCVIDNFKYVLHDDIIELVDYLGDEKAIIVEDGVDVLGKKCFYKKSIEHVTLPSTVTYICNSAFRESSVKTVILNTNLDVIIDNNAFCDSLLSNINLENVISIGFKAFTKTQIKFVDISKCKFIGKRAFDSCKMLDTVYFNQDSRVVIKEHAFIGSGLKELVLNEADIKDGAFSYCYNLKNVLIYDKCDFEYRIFNYCENLKKVYAPNIEYLSNNMFYNCGDFEEFITPNIKHLYSFSFENTGNLNVIAFNLDNLASFSFCNSKGNKRIYVKTKKIADTYYLNLEKYEYLLFDYNNDNNILNIFEVDNNCNIIKKLNDDDFSFKSRERIIDSLFRGE